MALPYNNTSPEETETLKNSQPKMLQNFESIKTIVEENHVGFGEVLHGCHKYAIMPNAPVPPDLDPATDPTDLRLFARVDSGPNFPQLWVKYPDNTVSQLTGSNSGSTGSSGPGWSKFPSGIIMKWGTATVTQNVPGRYVFFPTGPTIPAFTKAVSYIKITPTDNKTGTFDKFYTLQGYGLDKFFIGDGPNFPITINWFAIGV